MAMILMLDFRLALGGVAFVVGLGRRDCFLGMEGSRCHEPSERRQVTDPQN